MQKKSYQVHKESLHIPQKFWEMQLFGKACTRPADIQETQSTFKI